MEPNERFELIQQVGTEIIQESELQELLAAQPHFTAYDGFEPSGRIHIAQGLLRAINVNKMTQAGAKFKMFVADWHAWANNKLGGDLAKIQTTGKYFIEVWKACGMDMENVEFVWASDIVKDSTYWELVMKIAIKNSLKRVLRTVEIMGRQESETLHASQILYPCMQAADIFYLNADVAQLGMDQRKVNMMAREVADTLGRKKPISVSHHMLMGLTQPPESGLTGVERAVQLKMSKSKPDTAIFMTDSDEDVNRKFKKAYCPEKEVADNPVLEYCRYIIFEKIDTFEIQRPEKFGGNVTFRTYRELEDAFVKGDVHPADLKPAVAKYINYLLDPVRDYFAKNEEARKLKEEVESFQVTR